MEQYIPKSALVAEIENWKQYTLECGYKGQGDYEDGNKQGRLDTCDKFLSFLDTLEVKEGDLENELKEDWLFADKTEVDCLECMCLTEDEFISLAKKYFKLGLKTMKGE